MMTDQEQTRAVMVIGIGCSGTSAVAGVVHKLGCPMGKPAHMGTHPVTGFPLWEDKCTYGLFTNPRPYAADDWMDKFRHFVTMHQKKPIWGWKNTMTINALPWLINVLRTMGNEPRIVAVHRMLTKSITGRMNGKCPPGVEHGLRDAMIWGQRAASQYYGVLATITELELCSVFHCDYEVVLSQPKETVNHLAEFVFDGLPAPSHKQVIEAIASIQQKREPGPAKDNGNENTKEPN